MRAAFILIAVLAWSTASSTPPTDDDYRVVYSTEDDFDTVRELLEEAIVNRGLVVSGVSEVGTMLARTGKDLGTDKRIFARAEVLEFCSAVLSRQMMEADPHTIAFCPYKIAVYSLPDDSKRIYLSHPRFHTTGGSNIQTALKAVESLLKSIIEEAIE